MNRQHYSWPGLFRLGLIITAVVVLSGLIPAAQANDSPVASSTRTILCFGNSLTAGYGLDRDDAYPAVLQHKIDAHGWPFRVVNAGLSGETSSGGRRRIGWLLRQKVDVLILELGANDGFRGIGAEQIQHNLQGIIDKTKSKYPGVKIIIAGMQMSPNLGPTYTAEFRALFPRLATANGAVLIPFFLEGVAGRPQLNLPDGIHPTAEGHQIVADNVWAVLKPVLRAFQ